MGALTEVEIFDRMDQAFLTIAECCDHLANEPKTGPTYHKLIKEIDVLEGCCRQAGHWREDSRWMKLGLDMRPFRQRCGNWLRSDVRAQFRKDIFTKAASTMRKLHKDAQRLKTQRTGQLGTILPVAGEGPLRSRPVQVKTPGGLIIPAGTSLH